MRGEARHHRGPDGSFHSMRILHTADWHLGARFHDQERGDDEQHALTQILELSRAESVDAVLIAGDVFDTPNPGAEEQQRYYRALAALVREAGVGSVVVIAGNHDSGLRIEGPRDLLRNLEIHTVGRLGRQTDPAAAVVPLRDREGRERAVCAALPYLRDGDLRLPRTAESAGEASHRHARALALRYAEIRERAEERGLPLVVMGHLTVRGGLFGGGERTLAANADSSQVSAAELAAGASYLALGHLHLPQALDDQPHWRYSGSLLPNGFDETQVRREVVVADLPDDGGPATVRRIPLRPYREYRRLRGSAEDVRRELEGLPLPETDAPAPWCEATVELEGPQPGLARELAQLGREREWRLVSVRRQRQSQEPDPAEESAPSLEELQPEDVFRRLHESVWKAPPDEELMAEFRQLLREVESPHGG